MKPSVAGLECCCCSLALLTWEAQVSDEELAEYHKGIEGQFESLGLRLKSLDLLKTLAIATKTNDLYEPECALQPFVQQ